MVRVSADERRERLVEAAIRVMARDGVANATTRKIVAEADMPLGVFHYCFRSKEELLILAAESLGTRNIAVVMETVDRQRDLRDTVSACLQAYWATVEDRPEEHQVTYELTQYVLREPALAVVAKRQYDRYLTDMAELLDVLADAADVEWLLPTPVLARYVISIIEGLTLAWLVDRDTATTSAVLDQLADQAVAMSRRRTARPASGAV